MVHQIVAKRYASALFSAANAAGILERVEKDFPMVLNTIEENADLKMFLNHPAVGAPDKKDTIGRLFKDRIHPMLADFLMLIVDKNREGHLDSIRVIFDELLVEYRGQVRAQVSSAFELPDDAKKELTAKLSAFTGKSVELQVVVDPGLIGGISVRMGDRVLDGSVRSGLARMKETLSAVKVR